MDAFTFFKALTAAEAKAFEAEAVADPRVRRAVEGGAEVLMAEMLDLLNELKDAPTRDRIAAMVDLLGAHSIRGFSLGFAFARHLHESAAHTAEHVVAAARKGN